MTVKTSFRKNFRTKTVSLDSQSSALKIAPVVPPVCYEKQVFSTSPSVYKTIKCYYVISNKTFFGTTSAHSTVPVIKRPLER